MTPSAAQIVEALGGRGDKARCPAHDDAHASLHVTQADDRVLVKCFAGCSQAEVIDALRDRGLWDEKPVDNTIKTVLVWRDPTTGKTREQHRLDSPPNPKKMWWAPGGPAPRFLLYEARVENDGPIVVAEGGKAANAVARLGVDAIATVNATTLPALDRLVHYTRGREVILWPDNDAAGIEHMKTLSALDLGAASVAVVVPALLGLTEKGEDAADFRPRDSIDVVDLLRESSGIAETPMYTACERSMNVPRTSRERSANVHKAFTERSRSVRDDPDGGAKVGHEGPLDPPKIWRSWSEVESAPLVPDCILPLLAWEARLSVLVGDSKSGKTTLLADAIGCALMGREFLGTMPDQPGRIAIVQEMGAESMRAWIARHGVTEADIDFVDVVAYADLVAYLEARRPALTVVDTLAALAAANRADENAAGDMRLLANVLRSTGSAGLVVHHENKSGQYRGSTDIRAACDQLIELKREEHGLRSLTYIGRWPQQRVELSFDKGAAHFVLADSDNDVGRLLHYIRERPGCTKGEAWRGAGFTKTHGYKVVTRAQSERRVEIDGDGRMFVAGDGE